jgi:hypothetical protein
MDIWNFRDDMLESGCEVDADYLKSWISCLIIKKSCIVSLAESIFGLNNATDNFICNSLFMTLLEKVKPTQENNVVMEHFSIKIVCDCM